MKLLKIKGLIGFLLTMCLTISQAKDIEINIHDIGKVYHANVQALIDVTSTSDIRQAIKRAHETKSKITIAGKKHSQGGQTLLDNSIHLNMLTFNKILAFDKKRKLITVQPGVTWKQIQDFINSHNLAIKVMQSSNIFTVGGSIAVNAHGRDPNYGPVIETIRSFHLMLADGTVVEVSPQKNKALFDLAVGGYGLFGIITDVSLELTDNSLLKPEYEQGSYHSIPSLIKKIRNSPKTSLFFARLNIVPGEHFLKDMYALRYLNTGHFKSKAPPIKSHKVIDSLVNKPLFDYSRKSAHGKKIRWMMEKRYYRQQSGKEISRNNAMNPSIDFLLTFDSEDSVDMLQEYYLPIEKFEPFTDKLRDIMKTNKVNLLNVTIRYEKKNTESVLSYARTDSIAVVLYFNQPLDKKHLASSKRWTRRLVQSAIDMGGSYYLAYQLWPSQKQLIQAYPGFTEFVKKKKLYDPDTIFSNRFYVRYALE